jgi:hypothetical protein
VRYKTETNKNVKCILFCAEALIKDRKFNPPENAREIYAADGSLQVVMLVT